MHEFFSVVKEVIPSFQHISRLKQILSEERQTSERLMPLLAQSEVPILPIGMSIMSDMSIGIYLHYCSLLLYFS